MEITLGAIIGIFLAFFVYGFWYLGSSLGDYVNKRREFHSKMSKRINQLGKNLDELSKLTRGK